MREDYQGMWSLFKKKKRRKAKTNLKEVHMKRSSRIELKAEKSLRTRAVAGGGGVGGGVGAWYGAQRKKLIQ